MKIEPTTQPPAIPPLYDGDMVWNLLKDALQYVALVGSSDWDPRVTANARNLMVRITSLPEMAIKAGFTEGEGGSSPVQAGDPLQESPNHRSEQIGVGRICPECGGRGDVLVRAGFLGWKQQRCPKCTGAGLLAPNDRGQR